MRNSNKSTRGDGGDIQQELVSVGSGEIFITSHRAARTVLQCTPQSARQSSASQWGSCLSIRRSYERFGCYRWGVCMCAQQQETALLPTHPEQQKQQHFRFGRHNKTALHDTFTVSWRQQADTADRTIKRLGVHRSVWPSYQQMDGDRDCGFIVSAKKD